MLVDGVPAHLGQKVDPEIARVEIDGIPLPIKPGLVHYLVYKPTGVISTADDPQGRPICRGNRAWRHEGVPRGPTRRRERRFADRHERR